MLQLQVEKQGENTMKTQETKKARHAGMVAELAVS
jgi:hypothetical protein